MRRVGPDALDRVAAIAVALALHALVLGLALSVSERMPVLARPRSTAQPWTPVRYFGKPPAAAPTSDRRRLPGRASVAPEEPVRVAEREIIRHGGGVTMTIEGGLDGGVGGAPAPPVAAEVRWLRTEVFIAPPDTAPHPSHYCAPAKPEMPEEALEGRVEVTYEVDADGIVRGMEIEGAAPHLLARAVSRWLRGCLFDPAVRDGRRVSARVRQSFVFTIR